MVHTVLDQTVGYWFLNAMKKLYVMQNMILELGFKFDNFPIFEKIIMNFWMKLLHVGFINLF